MTLILADTIAYHDRLTPWCTRAAWGELQAVTTIKSAAATVQGSVAHPITQKADIAIARI